MIISASRRTDIPALYTPWFINRLRAGFVLTPNPYNPQRLTRLEFSPKTVDGIVFWSKNPAPLLPFLPHIQSLGYRAACQFTLTPYGRELESGLPAKEQLLEVFHEMSAFLGPQHMTWRYDPIVFEGGFDAVRHVEAFGRMARELRGATHQCVFSFADNYRHLRRKFVEVNLETMRNMTAKMLRLAFKNEMTLASCCEAADFSEFGVPHAACISLPDMENLSGSRLIVKQAVGQRAGCLCVEAQDVGVYDTCTNGCVYCYATRNAARAASARKRHDPASPMLIGHPTGGEDIVTKRPHSHKSAQGSLFAI